MHAEEVFSKDTTPEASLKDIRIGMLAGSYQPARCGVAHYTARLREALARAGVHVSLYTDAASAAQDRQARGLKGGAEGIAKGVTGGWTYRHLLPLARSIRRDAPDLLHIQHAGGTYGFQRAVFLLPPLLRHLGYGGRIVTTLHEYGWWTWSLPAPLGRFDARAHALARWGQRRGWWDEEDGFLLTGSDHLITTNTGAEGALLARLPHLAARTTRVPVGVNITVQEADREADRGAARAHLRRHLGWSDGARVVAFFGFLHPVKGLETLLRAFPHVLQKQPETRLLLIGGAESLALRGEEAASYRASLERLAETLGLGGKVALTGYVADEAASSLLWGADLGVLPFNQGVTLKSGSLLTLLAHHLPVVGTRPEEVEPALAPLLTLAPPKDERALAKALLERLHTLDSSRPLTEAGQAFAQRCSWETVAQQHLDIYRRLCGAPEHL